MFHVYKEVLTYVTPAGEPVFEEWLVDLRDRKSRNILLLCGGDKSTQDRDIVKAKEYFEEFRRRP